MTTFDTRADLLAALEEEDPQLYVPAPAADAEGLTLTELGRTLCARFEVPVEADEYGLEYAVLDGQIGAEPVRTQER